MNYKEQLEELYIQLNNELILLRSRRVKRSDIFKLRLDSLNQQIKLVEKQLADIKEGGNVNARVRFD